MNYFISCLRKDLPGCEVASLPQRPSLDLGSHYFPLLLPRHYCFITVLDFFFLLHAPPFDICSLRLAGFSRENPRRGNASLRIAAAASRSGGRRQGFARLFPPPPLLV